MTPSQDRSPLIDTSSCSPHKLSSAQFKQYELRTGSLSSTTFNFNKPTSFLLRFKPSASSTLNWSWTPAVSPLFFPNFLISFPEDLLYDFPLTFLIFVRSVTLRSPIVIVRTSAYNSFTSRKVLVSVLCVCEVWCCDLPLQWCEHRPTTHLPPVTNHGPANATFFTIQLVGTGNGKYNSGTCFIQRCLISFFLFDIFHSPVSLIGIRIMILSLVGPPSVVSFFMELSKRKSRYN
ncbi:hypothetical protein EDC94DRAFT_586552 [Helicostylum pulchrum]|nr:hypothetical protein EDC94DRAFT_586552 [Helicostylum pulchrum]